MYKIIGVLTISLFLSACMPTWTYDNQKYVSSGDAIQAAREDIRMKVNTVSPIDQPIANSILVYTPSLNWARNGVLISGAASEEQIRYVSTVLYYGYYSMAEGLKKRAIFNKLNIMEFSQRDPLTSRNYDYLLWLRLDGPDSAQWMISKANDTSSPTPLYTSPISDGGDRLSAFVNSIESYVRDSE
jgi:hypothetical protein